MSATPVDLPMLVSQLPVVQQIANTQHMAPEVQQSLAAPVVAQQQKLEQEKVQTVDKQDPATPITRERRDGRRRRRMQQRPRQAAPKPEEREETAPANVSPWAGNILDMKI
jgi:hypothetical protein